MTDPSSSELTQTEALDLARLYQVDPQACLEKIDGLAYSVGTKMMLEQAVMDPYAYAHMLGPVETIQRVVFEGKDANA